MQGALILLMFSNAAMYAQRGESCGRRAARIMCHAYMTIGSGILFAGGILAAVCKQPEPAHIVAGTSVMLLSVGGHGVYSGLHGLAHECREWDEEVMEEGEGKED